MALDHGAVLTGLCFQRFFRAAGHFWSPGWRNFEVETQLELRYGAFVNSEVNTDDPIGKVVGRRTRISDPLVLGCALNATMNELHRAFGTRVRQCKGVFRFKTWEELAAWETANRRSQSPAHRRGRIWPSFAD